MFTWDYEVIISQSGVLSRVLKLRNDKILNQDKKNVLHQHNTTQLSLVAPLLQLGAVTEPSVLMIIGTTVIFVSPANTSSAALWPWCSLESVVLILFNFLLMHLMSPKPNKRCWFVWRYKPDVISQSLQTQRKDFDSCSICFFLFLPPNLYVLVLVPSVQKHILLFISASHFSSCSGGSSG